MEDSPVARGRGSGSRVLPKAEVAGDAEADAADVTEHDVRLREVRQQTTDLNQLYKRRYLDPSLQSLETLKDFYDIKRGQRNYL